MQTSIRKWGNSAGIVIPASILKEIGVGVGSNMKIEVVKNSIVLCPSTPNYTLSELLSYSEPESLVPDADDLIWLNIQHASKGVI